MRSAFRASIILLTAALALSAYGLANLGGPGSTASGQASPATTCLSTVSLSGYDSLTWSSTTIGPVCSTVSFTVTNTGSIAHTFTVSNLLNQSDPSLDESSAASYFSWPNLYYTHDLNATGSADSTLHVTIHFQGVGYYQFTCIPHYGVGMWGKIWVLMTAPVPPTAPLIEPFWFVVFAVVGLSVVTFVAGLYYGRSGRAKEEREMRSNARRGPGSGRPAPPRPPPAPPSPSTSSSAGP